MTSYRTFAYRGPNSEVIISTLIDPDMDPFKEIDKDGIILQHNDIPKDAHKWFESIEMNNMKKLNINIDKARDQTRKRLREDRQPLLQKLDVEFQRRLETNPIPDITIVSEKNRLRNITRLVEYCTNTDELIALKC